MKIGFRGIAGLFGGALVLLSLLGCGWVGTKSTYRFRLTVEVDTPQGVRSGSSVYEATARYVSGFMSDPSGINRSWGVRGEAVAVNMPDGKMLFALMKTDDSYIDDFVYLSMKTLDPKFNNDLVESARRISLREGIRSPALVAKPYYPMLVTFTNIRNPNTVTKVNPDDLAADFGRGVRLKRIFIARTDDPISTGLEKRLPWLPFYYDKLFDGRNFEEISPNLSAHLGAGSFSTELSQ